MNVSFASRRGRRRLLPPSVRDEGRSGGAVADVMPRVTALETDVAELKKQAVHSGRSRHEAHQRHVAHQIANEHKPAARSNGPFAIAIAALLTCALLGTRETASFRRAQAI
jgi:hypothetical protein